MKPIPPEALCPHCRKPGCDVAERCSDIRTVIARLKGNRPDPSAVPDHLVYYHASCRAEASRQFQEYVEEWKKKPRRRVKCPACLNLAALHTEGERLPVPISVPRNPSGWGRLNFDGERAFIVCGYCGFRWEWSAPP